jgi:hypothetical protein
MMTLTMEQSARLLDAIAHSRVYWPVLLIALSTGMRRGDPSLPITKRSTRQHAMAVLKEKLGDLARDPHPYDAWRKRAPPVQGTRHPTGTKEKRK